MTKEARQRSVQQQGVQALEKFLRVDVADLDLPRAHTHIPYRHVQSLVENVYVEGLVTGVEEYALFVALSSYPGVIARLPQNHVPVRGRRLDEVFCQGDSIHAIIHSVDAKEGRVTLDMREVLSKALASNSPINAAAAHAAHKEHIAHRLAEASKIVEGKDGKAKAVASQEKPKVNQVLSVVNGLEPCQLVTGVVTGVRDYGLLVTFEGVTGLLPIQLVSQARVKHLDKHFKQGDHIRALVWSRQPERGLVKLSTKQLEGVPGQILHEPTLVYNTAPKTAQKLRATSLAKKVALEKRQQVENAESSQPEAQASLLQSYVMQQQVRKAGRHLAAIDLKTVLANEELRKQYMGVLHMVAQQTLQHCPNLAPYQYRLLFIDCLLSNNEQELLNLIESQRKGINAAVLHHLVDLLQVLQYQPSELLLNLLAKFCSDIRLRWQSGVVQYFVAIGHTPSKEWLEFVIPRAHRGTPLDDMSGDDLVDLLKAFAFFQYRPPFDFWYHFFECHMLPLPDSLRKQHLWQLQTYLRQLYNAHESSSVSGATPGFARKQ